MEVLDWNGVDVDGLNPREWYPQNFMKFLTYLH